MLVIVLKAALTVVIATLLTDLTVELTGVMTGVMIGVLTGALTGEVTGTLQTAALAWVLTGGFTLLLCDAMRGDDRGAVRVEVKEVAKEERDERGVG